MSVTFTVLKGEIKRNYRVGDIIYNKKLYAHGLYINMGKDGVSVLRYRLDLSDPFIDGWISDDTEYAPPGTTITLVQKF